MEERFRLILGDCRDAMREFPESSVDAVVTDPPYGLGFMNRDWDRFAEGLPNAEAWRGRRADTTVETKVGGADGSLRFPSGVYGGRNVFKRCKKCKRREFSGTPCTCPEKDWQLEAPGSAPVHMVVFQRWCEEWAAELLRVLKPGGHVVAFGGGRTYHRLTIALEDAGFEIRDCLMWLHGEGFPKSLDVGKAIDKAAGAERPVVGTRTDGVGNTDRSLHKHEGFASAREKVYEETAPATEAAKEWDGWGTALKPCWEPIVLARKPLSGTVEENVRRYGTGAVNVDACRLPTDDQLSFPRDPGTLGSAGSMFDKEKPGSRTKGAKRGRQHDFGRWPSNWMLCHSSRCMQAGDEEWACVPDCPIRRLDDQSGRESASRFFYCPKAGRRDRDEGLDDMPTVKAHEITGRKEGSPGQLHPRSMSHGDHKNAHPTVKPVDLMRWLCRLVTPPGGLILDPFMGSGSTGKAAMLEGFRFVGVEIDPDMVEVSRRRIGHAAGLQSTPD